MRVPRKCILLMYKHYEAFPYILEHVGSMRGLSGTMSEHAYHERNVLYSQFHLCVHILEPFAPCRNMSGACTACRNLMVESVHICEDVRAAMNNQDSDESCVHVHACGRYEQPHFVTKLFKVVMYMCARGANSHILSRESCKRFMKMRARITYA